MMQLSEKRSSELYAAIYEPTMQKRITIRNSANVLGTKNVNDIDIMLHKLELEIWREVRKALNISGS